MKNVKIKKNINIYIYIYIIKVNYHSNIRARGTIEAAANIIR